MSDSDSSPTERKKKFYKILIAADGSEESMDAADYAIEIARKCDSELIALYVIL
jgi:nucleotide-binding universal stress UspA family protein